MKFSTRWVAPHTAALGLLVSGILLLSSPASVLAQSEWRLDDWDKTYEANENVGDWNSQKFAPVLGSGDEFFYQFVHEKQDEHFLHVKSGKNNSFSVGLKKKFRMKDWPMLTWQWRVTELPMGGDVRVKELDDQAGSVCVIEGPGTFGFDAALCYLWENDGPKDTPITSTKNDKARYIILRTGKEDGTGGWFTEQRNIGADFRTVFGREPKADAVVGIQIDSDDTKSRGEAFYRNIVLKKQ